MCGSISRETAAILVAFVALMIVSPLRAQQPQTAYTFDVSAAAQPQSAVKPEQPAQR